MDTNNIPNKVPAGLPINNTNTATTAADIEIGDHVMIMRRVECRPSSPPPISKRPSISLGFKRIILSPSPSSIDKTLKIPLLKPEGPLNVGPNTTSLIDDDNDLVDYFPPAKRPRIVFRDDVCASSSILWKIQEHQVPTIPAFYPLEQSSVFVPNVLASTLATCITNVLQARSIAASYDELNAKVDCISKAQVEFRIRMYRVRDEYHDSIIVEVQRLYGFDFGYSRCVRHFRCARESQTCHE